jgi:hypothetical protein
MHSFTGLKDHVATECPADSKLASALASSPVKVSITPQMYREAKQQRNTRVLDPAEARIVNERNAVARQKADERKSLQETRAAMFRACSDDLRAASLVSRRDRYAMQAAHAQYAQCMSAARAQ